MKVLPMTVYNVRRNFFQIFDILSFDILIEYILGENEVHIGKINLNIKKVQDFYARSGIMFVKHINRIFWVNFTYIQPLYTKVMFHLI